MSKIIDLGHGYMTAEEYEKSVLKKAFDEAKKDLAEVQKLIAEAKEVNLREGERCAKHLEETALEMKWGWSGLK
jgi:hypothetical protein